jgi:hypothetical protein
MIIGNETFATAVGAAGQRLVRLYWRTKRSCRADVAPIDRDLSHGAAIVEYISPQEERR